MKDETTYFQRKEYTQEAWDHFMENDEFEELLKKYKDGIENLFEFDRGIKDLEPCISDCPECQLCTYDDGRRQCPLADAKRRMKYLFKLEKLFKETPDDTGNEGKSEGT